MSIRLKNGELKLTAIKALVKAHNKLMSWDVKGLNRSDLIKFIEKKGYKVNHEKNMLELTGSAMKRRPAKIKPIVKSASELKREMERKAKAKATRERKKLQKQAVAKVGAPPLPTKETLKKVQQKKKMKQELKQPVKPVKKTLKGKLTAIQKKQTAKQQAKQKAKEELKKGTPPPMVKKKESKKILFSDDDNYLGSKPYYQETYDFLTANKKPLTSSYSKNESFGKQLENYPKIKDKFKKQDAVDYLLGGIFGDYKFDPKHINDFKKLKKNTRDSIMKEVTKVVTNLCKDHEKQEKKILKDGEDYEKKYIMTDKDKQFKPLLMKLLQKRNKMCMDHMKKLDDLKK